MKKLSSILFLLTFAAALVAVPPTPTPSTKTLSINAATGELSLPFGQLPAKATHADPALSVDRLIAGKSATTDRALFTSMVHTGTPAYVRNPVWADLDLTCFSPWNSAYGVQMGGCAISRRHVLLAEHFSGATGSAPVANGTTWRFVTKGNVIVDRTISSKARVGSTDLCIALLNADLPDTITPARVLPAGFADYLPQHVDLPVIYSDQEKKLHVRELFMTLSASFNSATSSDTFRAAWDEAVIVGDSGSPMFIVLGKTPVLLGLFQTSGSGPSITANLAATNTVMATLGGGYSLTEVNPVAAVASRSVRGTALAIVGNRKSSLSYASGSANIPAFDVSNSNGTGMTIGGASPGIGLSVVNYAGTPLEVNTLSAEKIAVFKLNGIEKAAVLQDGSLTSASAITSSSSTSGVGYTTGAGGTVTQITSKSTGVTLNKVTGEITMHNAALNAGSSVSFILTNSAIAAADYLLVQQVGGASMSVYVINAVAGAGSATITLRNVTAGSPADAVVLKFVVIKAATS